MNFERLRAFVVEFDSTAAEQYGLKSAKVNYLDIDIDEEAVYLYSIIDDDGEDVVVRPDAPRFYCVSEDDVNQDLVDAVIEDFDLSEAQAMERLRRAGLLASEDDLSFSFPEEDE